MGSAASAAGLRGAGLSPAGLQVPLLIRQKQQNGWPCCRRDADSESRTNLCCDRQRPALTPQVHLCCFSARPQVLLLCPDYAAAFSGVTCGWGPVGCPHPRRRRVPPAGSPSAAHFRVRSARRRLAHPSVTDRHTAWSLASYPRCPMNSVSEPSQLTMAGADQHVTVAAILSSATAGRGRATVSAAARVHASRAGLAGRAIHLAGGCVSRLVYTPLLLHRPRSSRLNHPLLGGRTSRTTRGPPTAPWNSWG